MPKSIPEYGNQLHAADWQVRRDAAKRLSTFGSASSLVINEVSKNLEDPNWHVRDAAAETLGNLSTSRNWKMHWKRPGLKVKKSVSELATRLADPSLGIRRTARNGLDMMNTVGSFGDLRACCGAAVPGMVNRLREENWPIRESAATALGQFGPSAIGAVCELSRCLGDDSYNVRRAAKHSLENLFNNRAIVDYHALGTLAVPDLVKKLDVDPTCRCGYVFRENAKFCPRKKCGKKLVDLNWDVRVGAAWGLGFVGGCVAVNMAQFAQELQHNDWGVRWLAAEAIGNLGGAGVVTLPDLLDMLLSDPDASVQDAATLAIRKMRGALTRTPSCITPEVASLLPKLRDADFTVREESSKAVMAMGNLVLPGLPVILDIILNDKRKDVRLNVQKVFENLRDIGCLGSLDDDAMSTAVIPALQKRLRDVNWVVRLSAAEAMSRLVVFASRVVVPMTEARDNEDSDTKSIAKAFAAKQMFRRMAKKAAMADIESVVESAAHVLLHVMEDYPDKELRDTATASIKMLEKVGFDFGTEDGDYDDGHSSQWGSDASASVPGTARTPGTAVTPGRTPGTAGTASRDNTRGSSAMSSGFMVPVAGVRRTRAGSSRGFREPNDGWVNPPMMPWRGGIFLPPKQGEDTWVNYDALAGQFELPPEVPVSHQ